MSDDDHHELDTLAVHAAQPPDAATGAVTPPIHLSTTFAQLPGSGAPYEYSRSDNPTRRALEACLAALEGGAAGVAFASGSAATLAVMSTLSAGEHLVTSDDVYGGTYRIVEQLLAPRGVAATRVDMASPEAVERALRDETRMLWVESPTNPLLKLADLSALGELAARRGLALVVDNTFATPVLQRPLELGATAVVHSTTKYLNGHADVVGGAVVTSDPSLLERLRFYQNAAGGVPSPFDCYLVLRGLKTLPIRMRRQCETAAALARFLDGSDAVARVHYPGLASHPQAALGSRQMALPGAMLSFELAGGGEGARRALAALKLIACAESLGGVESLIEHPASMTHATVPPELRQRLGISEALLRLSVGLEAEADLRRDLARALASA